MPLPLRPSCGLGRLALPCRVRASLPLLLALTACDGDTSPYVEGGDWQIAPCTQAQRRALAAAADETVGGVTRDFALLDQYAYRVSLSDFCDNTVVVVVGDMGVPESVAAIDDLVALYDTRPSGGTDLTVITTWYRTSDDRVPEVGDLRRFSELVGADLLERGADPDGHLTNTAGVFQLPMLRDPPRFENAAIAASAMWLASDAPQPFVRFQRETEVAGRWGVRVLPFYAVLHPPEAGTSDPPTLVALGSDLVADRIIEAAQTNPLLWVPCPDGDTDGDDC